jgi:hypothetical protein
VWLPKLLSKPQNLLKYCRFVKSSYIDTTVLLSFKFSCQRAAVTEILYYDKEWVKCWIRSYVLASVT